MEKSGAWLLISHYSVAGT